jgi:general secretion pathway protein A
MYLNFFELSKTPFSLAPDPEFLYLSQQHKDALGAIIYGIRAKQGFVSVVGEVGTGKTTIVRAYLSKFGQKQILPIYIFNSRISFSELMEFFLREIGISGEVIKGLKTVNEMVMVAYQAMLEKAKTGSTIVLIIDEAQNMPTDTLAKLCILSNFETAKSKLIQIVLVGQPELQKKLSLYELRQLRQRIAYRALIKHMSTKDSINYLNHRLSLSAKGNKPVFSKRAVNKIVDYSKGVPRVINILCENSLVAGYGLQKKPVSLKIVKKVIAEYEDKCPSFSLQASHVAGGVLVLLLVAASVASYIYPQFASYLHPQHLSKVLSTGPTKIISTIELQGEALVDNTDSLAANNRDADRIDQKSPSSNSSAGEVSSSDNAKPDDNVEAIRVPRSWESFSLTLLSEPPNEAQTRYKEQVRLKQSINPTVEQDMVSRPSPRLIVAQKGDTVSSLCQSMYGFVNAQVLKWIRIHNPHISNLDEIRVDEVIYFPEIKTTNYFKVPRRAINHASATEEELVSR